MRATFIELPPFARHRVNYLDDETYRNLQNALMRHPDAGDVIPGTGGLRKLRYNDRTRGKGKRGGLRVIYYWRISVDQRKALVAMLRRELRARSTK